MDQPKAAFVATYFNDKKNLKIGVVISDIFRKNYKSSKILVLDQTAKNYFKNLNQKRDKIVKDVCKILAKSMLPKNLKKNFNHNFSFLLVELWQYAKR